MNLVETSLPADLIRQSGFFVIKMEAFYLISFRPTAGASK
jgi:hypothetical protein